MRYHLLSSSIWIVISLIFLGGAVEEAVASVPCASADQTILDPNDSVSSLADEKTMIAASSFSSKKKGSEEQKTPSNKQKNLQKHDLRDKDFNPDEYQLSGRKKPPKRDAKSPTLDDRFEGEMDHSGRKVRPIHPEQSAELDEFSEEIHAFGIEDSESYEEGDYEELSQSEEAVDQAIDPSQEASTEAVSVE
ncbi:MAG: hypothetical protein AAGI90_06655 [Chlamydiota bacterium]